MKFGVDFRCVFGMFFGGVLEWFWGCFGWLFGAKTMIRRKRDDLWKSLFYVCNIAVFKGSGINFGCQKDRKTEWDAELDAKSVMSSFRVHFGSHFGC